MDDREIEIMAYCSSEKESASIGFGVSYTLKDHPDGPGMDWIGEGFADSFWENYYEFEPGIERAKQLMQMNPEMSFREALFKVFGKFSVTYEVDGVEKNLSYNVDADGIMYSMLESCGE